MRVAIVHDWLIGGGAERVVEQLHLLYPDAPVYTSYANDEWRNRLDNKVVTGILQNRLFFRLRKFIPFLRAWWFSRLDFSDYDLVISSSGAEAKGVRVPNGVVHVNYCHAPTHYYWDRYEEYLERPGFGPFDWLARLGLRLLVGPMRKWDFKAAQRPHVMIANSAFTAQKIKQYYGREAAIIHPPVDIKRFASKKKLARKGFVVGGRQTPYKRFDIAITACNRLSIPLTVLGDGPEHERLVKIAGETIMFVRQPSDQEMVRYIQSTEAFIFPGLDDFGIVAVEAMAAGTPIIAQKKGGALDYITERVSGLFFDEPTADSLEQALKQFQKQTFSAAEVAQQAEAFSPEKFRSSLRAYIDKVVKEST